MPLGLKIIGLAVHLLSDTTKLFGVIVAKCTILQEMYDSTIKIERFYNIKYAETITVDAKDTTFAEDYQSVSIKPWIALYEKRLAERD